MATMLSSASTSPDHPRAAYRAWLQHTTHHATQPVEVAVLGGGLAASLGGGWDGRAVAAGWSIYFPDYRTLNLGADGQEPHEVLHLVDSGVLARLRPQVIILALSAHERSAATAQGTWCDQYRDITQQVRRAAPDSHVVVVHLPSPGGAHPWDRARWAALGDARVHTLDLAWDLANRDGSLKCLGWAADGRHFDAVGAEMLAMRLHHLLAELLARRGGGRWDAPTHTRLRFIDEHPAPVIDAWHPDAHDNRYGLEGGSVIKVAGIYHLFTAEMAAPPRWNGMRLAHWTSTDRLHWQRRPTLFTSSNDLTGTDPRAALWAPMPIYDENEQRWNLFYVAYRTLTHPDGLAGRIFRAVARHPGRDGIDGPWDDVGVILRPDAATQAWEGSQGVDSFYPYQVGDRWLAFYGSSDARSWFRVGLAEAPTLAGPWTRRTDVNPVTLCGPRGPENPIVTRHRDGRYLAVFEDVFHETGFGLAESLDGIHWHQATEVNVTASHAGLVKVRTPLGLVPEDDGSYSLLYTGYSARTSPAGDAKWGELWSARVEIDERTRS